MRRGGGWFQGVKPLNLNAISRFAAYYREEKGLIQFEKIFRVG